MLDGAGRADTAVADEGDGLALPLELRAVEGVLQNRCRTVIILGDGGDEGVEFADALALGFRLGLSIDAPRISLRRRLVIER